MQASRVARPGVIVAAGWVVVLLYAFPGVMTEEAFEALRQTRSRFFAPENPPGFSGVWRWLELVLAGPTAVLLLQTSAFAIGAFTLLRRRATAMTAAWVTAGLLVFPPVMVVLATIHSQSLATGLLVLGAAAVGSDVRRTQHAGVAVLAVACAVQPHMLLAALPILVLALRPLRGGAAWLVVAVLALAATKHWSKKPAAPLWSYVEPTARTSWTGVAPRELPDTALWLGIPTRTTALQDGWTDVLSALAPLFSPWLYFALALVIVPLALRAHDALSLALGGVLVVVAYRDPAWLTCAASLAAAIVAVRWRRA